jgi:hypothetical protein
MPGGLLQLVARGAHDEYYTSNNPDIVFFKSVYRKFNHFAQQLIQLDDDITGNNLSSFDTLRTLKYKIPRNANLINRLFLEFELPSIYSLTDNFQWIRRIGEYIIKEARIISSNNFVYQRLTGEYIHIYHETNLSEGAKKEYYKSIGHVPDMYDPASINKYDNYNYPATTKPENGDNVKPSINKRRIIVPLPFWFTTENGCALPISAVQGQEFKIEIDLRPLNEIYTILNSDEKRIRPTSNDGLNNYTNDAVGLVLSNNNVRLYANYIFLDTKLATLFNINSHTYLMRQVQYFTDDISGTANPRIDLKNINFPITQFYFALRRKDNANRNQWDNYTLWDYEGSKLQDPFAVGYYDYGSSNGVSEFDNNFSSYKSELATPDIITHHELQFNGKPYYSELPIEFMRVNRFMNNKNDGDLEGIYNYSFSLNNKFQPSGICNFSAIEQKEMRLTLKNLIGETLTDIGNTQFNNEYEVLFIFENLNILEIQGGLAGVKFVN